MKIPLTIFLTLCISASTAFARIGDTPQQNQERYGAPYKTTSDYAYYRKSGFGVMISYYQGKADSITYRKMEENALGKGADISDNEISMLLKLNADARAWKKRDTISMDREWFTEDESLFAFYKTFENYLSVMTMAYLQRAAAEAKTKEEKALEGF